MSLLLAMFLSAAWADGTKVQIEPIKDLWIANDRTTAFPVDAEGTFGGQGSHLDFRQRLGLILSNDDISLAFVLGGQSDQIWGPGWNVPNTLDERHRHENRVRFPSLRNLSLTANLEYFQIQIGLTTSQWGLGMVANDGEHEPFFGQPEFGDRVVRARITTKPTPDGPWFFTVAWDRVIQDDLTLDAKTQWTNQAVVSSLWRHNDDQAGVSAIFRRQEEVPEARSTSATAIDAYTKIQTPIAEGVNLTLGVEAAGMTGKTNRTTTYNSPKRLHILSGGVVAEGMVGFIDDSLQLGISTGYASGDGDPNDDTINDFSFDRNFGVGMIIFDEVMGGIDAAHYNIATNPKYAGQPPDGIEATVYEGAFRRASFLQPRFEYRPIQEVRLRGGVVMAWSTAPISHGFYTHRNGGTPVNHLQQPTSGYGLGTEYDWSVQIQPFVRTESFFQNTRVSLQGGHAFLGSNLGGETMGRIDRYILMLQL